MRLLFPILILAITFIAPSAAYIPDTLTVTFLDVGQGDSILVQAPNGHAMLVDAGESSAAPTVSAGLAGEGISRLEYVVATHDHADHIGGMIAVLPQVTVGQFITNGVPTSTQTAINLRTYLTSLTIPTDAATAGETLALDPANVTVTMLNPPAVPGTDQNEASVALRLVFGSQSFLLTGDAGTKAEGWMLASGRPVAARFLKVGHHGSDTATGAPFVAAVAPAIAVIEVGALNSYGHPSQAVVKRLQDSGAKVYSTASSGTVRITTTRTGYTMATADGPELPVTVPGAALPPTDLDFDGVFDDVNGNGRADFADIVLYFNQMTWISANEPTARFDFNRNARIDFADVVWLFNNMGVPQTTVPTTVPTTIPITIPTTVPTTIPITIPTTVLTTIPTTIPTTVPTTVKTTAPTTIATTIPTTVPTTVKTTIPTTIPTTATPAYTLTITGLDLANEWVSVRNTGAVPVQLIGCTITDESVHTYTFPAFVLAAGATVTVHTGSGTNTATDLYWGLGSNVWNNTGDTATLKRPDGGVISSLRKP